MKSSKKAWGGVGDGVPGGHIQLANKDSSTGNKLHLINLLAKGAQ